VRQEHAVATVIGRLDPLDLDPHGGMNPLDALDEFGPLARRVDDEDRLRVGHRMGQVYERALVLGRTMTGALRAALEITQRALGVDDNPVGVFGAEMENARPIMIDPDDGVIAALHRAIS
jgi:hypothetical protein